MPGSVVEQAADVRLQLLDAAEINRQIARDRRALVAAMVQVNSSNYGYNLPTKFAGLDYFPFNPKWRVKAKFQPYQPPRKIPITNVLGMTSDEISPGLLVFNVDGHDYRLEPILEQGEKDYFIIFRDATSGKETYPAARYLYASPPGADGKTIVDFNKAYNPPCAFTPYATCPLPPPQNRLGVRIDAGEKKYAGGHGG